MEEMKIVGGALLQQSPQESKQSLPTVESPCLADGELGPDLHRQSWDDFT